MDNQNQNNDNDNDNDIYFFAVFALADSTTIEKGCLAATALATNCLLCLIYTKYTIGVVRKVVTNAIITNIVNTYIYIDR